MRNHTSNRTALIFIALSAIVTLAGCSGYGTEQDSQTVEIAAENLSKGKAFLEENGKKDDVTTMPSGIQYSIIHESEEGKIPKLTDNVLIHLRMLHIDGSVINDSYVSNEPIKIYIKHTMGGWRKILTQMSVGSKWITYIPPHMAFSSRGNEIVGPNETIICEIELLEILW